MNTFFCSSSYCIDVCSPINLIHIGVEAKTANTRDLGYKLQLAEKTNISPRKHWTVNIQKLRKNRMPRVGNSRKDSYFIYLLLLFLGGTGLESMPSSCTTNMNTETILKMKI